LTPFNLQVSINEARHLLCALVAATGKKAILSRQTDGPHGALDTVVVELDTSVLKEPLQSVPVVQRIADRVGGRTAGRQFR